MTVSNPITPVSPAPQKLFYLMDVFPALVFLSSKNRHIHQDIYRHMGGIDGAAKP